MSPHAIPVAGPEGAQPNPFSRRAVLGIVLAGGALFVLLLWMIGTGTGFGSGNNGGGHAQGRGLNGYAAMAQYLEARGYDVEMGHGPDDLNPDGLLILTPPADADGQEIDRIVSAHRYKGATLVVAPKWVATPVTDKQRSEEKAERGWVNLVSARPPEWRGFLDDVAVGLGRGAEEKAAAGKDDPARWKGLGVAGRLPQDHLLAWGEGERLIPLVSNGRGQILAALLDDGGSYPDLEEVAQRSRRSELDDEDRYPLVLVFEPDLLDNFGMARPQSAALIEDLFERLEIYEDGPIVFDLTLSGFGQSKNLLTLAVTPPFAGVSLCLLLAALLVGWRGFVRFGPPATPERALALGKQALVANAAGLVRRSRRYHLLREPYTARARTRLVAALALPRALDAEAAEAAIDRALATRAPEREPFSAVAARLRSAHRPHDILKAARDLHALERTLTQ
ncbi:DUF4350 domain-containing protein [Novosphingobium sp. BW1]|uniref:DUF4350 domain-containing protein n=1 Tax=Novosphingobium sp. BW1 TaxID=2592621 RepID=UPI0011DEC3BA|nr:DUF4350 domain-containing protein [Novosphingobium sp. BW1]TYC89368.1 DUF4350 domain-containing protein [Novosphingobium sp. BW1]